MTNDLQNFYLYLKQQESNSKTMQSHFKEGNKTKEWFKEWEEHYSKCAFTLQEYCRKYKKVSGGLDILDLSK